MCRTTQGCSHLVCGECAQLKSQVQATADSDRNRGIYLGQNAAGVDQWMLPGYINLSRCPVCRAREGGEQPAHAPSVAQREQFDALKKEFEELEVARQVSCMLKHTNVLRRFLSEEDIVALVDEYVAGLPAGVHR